MFCLLGKGKLEDFLCCETCSLPDGSKLSAMTKTSLLTDTSVEIAACCSAIFLPLPTIVAQACQAPADKAASHCLIRIQAAACLLLSASRLEGVSVVGNNTP